MKQFITGISLLLIVLSADAQQKISIDSLQQHIGDSVTVCTKIYGGIFLDRSTGTPTLLNAGAAYPDSPLTIFISAEARKTFTEAPELFYKNKNVCVTGKIILYKDKPEIVLYDAAQLVAE